MARLMRSSSMGQSADLLRPFYRVANTIPMVSKEQKTEQNRKPAAKKVVAPSQIVKQEPPKVVAVAEKPRKSIFTFPSPPRVEKPRKANDQYFLDACALCKKKIGFEKDRFMYGDFQAFCSPECRDDQIALDEKFNPPSPVRVTQTRFIYKLNGCLKTKFIF